MTTQKVEDSNLEENVETPNAVTEEESNSAAGGEINVADEFREKYEREKAEKRKLLGEKDKVALLESDLSDEKFERERTTKENQQLKEQLELLEKKQAERELKERRGNNMAKVLEGLNPNKLENAKILLRGLEADGEIDLLDEGKVKAARERLVKMEPTLVVDKRSGGSSQLPGAGLGQKTTVMPGERVGAKASDGRIRSFAERYGLKG